MKLSNLFNDDKAVSPVIGVILMVAITVILAAVIGTFVLGLGDGLTDTTPSASISGELNENNETNVVFTHQSGQNIDVDNLRITDSGNNIDTVDPGDVPIDGNGDDSFSAGDTITTENFDGGEETGTVRLVFDDGSTSSTLSSVEYELSS